MKSLFRWLGRVMLALVVFVAAIALFGSREPVDLIASFDEEAFGDDLDGYFAAQEAAHSDIVAGTQKRVIWAGEAGVKTPISVVYLHGFSATSEEIRPVPDLVAQALGANLVYTRLAGHGRSGDAIIQWANRVLDR